MKFICACVDDQQNQFACGHVRNHRAVKTYERNMSVSHGYAVDIVLLYRAGARIWKL